MNAKGNMPPDAQREFDALAAKYETWRAWFEATYTLLTDGWAVSVDVINQAPPERKLQLIRLVAEKLQPTFDAMGDAPEFQARDAEAPMSPLLFGETAGGVN